MKEIPAGNNKHNNSFNQLQITLLTFHQQNPPYMIHLHEYRTDCQLLTAWFFETGIVNYSLKRRRLWWLVPHLPFHANSVQQGYRIELLKGKNVWEIAFKNIALSDWKDKQIQQILRSSQIPKERTKRMHPKGKISVSKTP